MMLFSIGAAIYFKLSSFNLDHRAVQFSPVDSSEQAVIQKNCHRVQLPDKLIICYADRYHDGDICDEGVHKAAVQGCNVIIWFSINIELDPVTSFPKISGHRNDYDCVASTATKLRNENVSTTHLISVGKAPRFPPPRLPPVIPQGRRRVERAAPGHAQQRQRGLRRAAAVEPRGGGAA